MMIDDVLARAGRLLLRRSKYPLLAFALIVLDWGFSGTVLISPLPKWYLHAFRIAGLICAIPLAVALFRANRKKLLARWLGIPAAIFLTIALFDATAWHIANRWNFALSSAPFRYAAYPVVDVHSHGKTDRDTMLIDPFGTGEPAEIPVLRNQFAYDYAGKCIAVEERRAPNGAVQIKTDGRATWFAPDEAHIEPCAHH